jgi:hypothetical protein
VGRITPHCEAASSLLRFFLVEGVPYGKSQRFSFFELFGIKAREHGRFAIVAVLSTFLVAGAGYFGGKTVGIW